MHTLTHAEPLNTGSLATFQSDYSLLKSGSLFPFPNSTSTITLKAMETYITNAPFPLCIHLHYPQAPTIHGLLNLEDFPDPSLNARIIKINTNTNK